MDKKREKRLKAVLATAYHDHEKNLTRYAHFKVNNHEKSQDLVQDAFMKTWLYLVRKGEIGLMKAFLYHVLNDLIIDEYRKRKALSLDVLLEKGFEPSVQNSERLFNTLDGESAMLLIKKLPEKYQRIMRMKYVQDLSLEEMALILGQSRNTIAVQAHRGLEKLKQLHDFPLIK